MWRVLSHHHGKNISKRTALTLNEKLCRSSITSHARVSEERVVGIRREDINVWERRSPIAPQHVKELREKNITVLVQPSTRRAYTMSEYESAGAIITEDLSPASLIMGVKQVPIDILIPNRTYAFFSHTIKAQEANMPLLDAMLDKNIRIVDYEKMVDAKGQRVAAFGKFAGVGGMINILHGVGLRLLALGHHTPFMYVGATHNYKNSRQARLAIYELGEDIKAGKLPKHFGPLSFVFTGSGNVSKGAQEVFQELPHIYVEPHELKDALGKFDHRTLVAAEVSREDYLVPKAGGIFNSEEFDEHPERYRSTFSEKIAPYASVIVNGVYWGPNNPRLLTYDDALQILEVKNVPDKYSGCPDLPHRLTAICDISADVGGSIEFMTECTTIEYPFELYDIKTRTSQLGMAGDGVLVCSIDNLPAQLPREATDYFGKLLLPWIPEMSASHASDPFENQDMLSNVVKNAVICSNGKLTPNYEYIARLRENQEKAQELAAKATTSSVQHRVLVLGAGMVASPLVQYLTRDGSVGITVVSSVSDEATYLSEMYKNTTPLVLDVMQSLDKVEKLVKDHDLVISLLPWVLHPEIGQLCVKHKTNMVTASYVTPGMKELNESAESAGITILQEVGLDPGIDHLLAMNCIDEVKDNGGKVVSFISYCGGLPAPEDAENSLRYKFSWSPRGALMSVLNGARFLRDGRVIEIPRGQLLEHARPLDMFPGFHLEGYPNRDSTHYIDAYRLDDVHTMVRGTMRYHGFTTVCQALMKLGILSEDKCLAFEAGKQTSWRKLTNSLLGTSNLSARDLSIVIYDKIGHNDVGLEGIRSLGLLSDDKIEAQGTPIDTLSQHLVKRLSYGPGERDIVLLRHQVGVEWPDNTKEQRDISLVAYGDPDGFSAMARTVSLPAAIASKMVLEETLEELEERQRAWKTGMESKGLRVNMTKTKVMVSGKGQMFASGQIVHKGNVTPLTRDVYLPMLKRLNAENIKWTTKITDMK